MDGVPETLSYLVYDATSGDTANRTESAAKFLDGLETVEEELTAPEPGPVIDPLEARVRDVLEGGFTVDDRLGSGATAVGLRVRREADDTPLVLKVARDEDKGRRLHDEAERLRKLRHPLVAHLIDGPLLIGGRTLAAALDRVVDVEGRPENHRLRLRVGVDPAELRAALDEAVAAELPEPVVLDAAVRGLKFAEILPPDLANRTLAARLGDESAARRVVGHPVQWSIPG